MAKTVKQTRKRKVKLDERPPTIEKQFDTNRKISIDPQTANQDVFIKSVKCNEVTVAIGPAGVGKTYCTAGIAAQLVATNLIDGVVLSRANVTVGRTIGALPGDVREKMEPLLMPMLDALRRHLGAGRVNYMLDKRQIELLPFEYIRGRSFINKFVIIDEAQNLTTEDIIAVVTRYESGKIVLLGDPFQNDLHGECGLLWLEQFATRNDFNMPVIVFSIDDVVRSGFVKKFIAALYRDRDTVAQDVESVSNEIPIRGVINV